MYTLAMKAHVFGGGGAGAAQQLAIYRNWLDQGNELPDLMTGTSAGGLLAIMLSHCGLDGAENELLSIRKRQDIFADHPMFGWGRLGLWSPKPLQNILKRVMKYKAKIPYYTTAYDIKNHHTHYFKESDGWFYNSATACIPILVEPVASYVDGGLAEGTPLKLPIEKGATDINIFMCFASGSGKPLMPSNKIEVLVQCYNGMATEIGRNDMRVCELMNQLGKKQVSVKMHLPKKNMIDALEFEKMQSVYKAMRI
jgi:predicted acylesterase/phospholipase RssA